MTNISDDRLQGYGDTFYARLMAAYEGQSFDACVRFNARLVLILANLVGDPTMLEAALAAAREPPSLPEGAAGHFDREADN